MSILRSVLIDPSPLWMQKCAGVLRESGVEVLAVATSFDEGSRLIREIRPELAVIDPVEEPEECSQWIREGGDRHPIFG